MANVFFMILFKNDRLYRSMVPPFKDFMIRIVFSFVKVAGRNVFDSLHAMADNHLGVNYV